MAGSHLQTVWSNPGYAIGKHMPKLQKPIFVDPEPVYPDDCTDPIDRHWYKRGWDDRIKQIIARRRKMFRGKMPKRKQVVTVKYVVEEPPDFF